MSIGKRIGGAVFDPTPEPIPGYKFQVYINAARMGFSKVTNIEESIETEALQEGGVNDRVYSLRTPVRSERTLVFERGLGGRGLLSSLPSLRFVVGQRIATDIIIVVGDRNGAIAAIYQVHGAVIKKCVLGDLDAMRSDIVIERFELTYETMERCPITAAALGTPLEISGLSAFPF